MSDIIQELSSKDISAVNKDLLIKNLRQDLQKYNAVLNGEVSSEEQLSKLFNLSNPELVNELQKYLNSNPHSDLELKSLDELQLSLLQKELADYYEKLLSLRQRMDDRLDLVLKERDDLFVKCQLLLDLLERS